MVQKSQRSHALTSKTRYFALALPLFSLASAIHTGCTGGGDLTGAGYGGAGTSSSSPSCSGSSTTCSDGVLTACEDGVTKTAACEDQCTADGFLPWSGGGCAAKFPERCACGATTNKECERGINALCTCLDTSPACQGFAILENYIRCHRDPSGETATLANCFAKYMSGDEVACNTAILSCGDSAPSNGCTANVDCGHCERCELSTGKCLTRLACD
jgi:hypothetical protein